MLIEFAVMHNEDALTGSNDETRAAPQTPQVKRFGLIGDPIAHSLSPALFRAGYGLGIGNSKEHATGHNTEFPVKTGKYSYDLIEGADFETSYRRFLDGYQGINVTAPFKEPAFAKADIRSPECQKIGATNLLVKTPEGIKAYNSDYSGIILSLLTAMHPDIDAEQFLTFLNGNAPQTSKESSGTPIAHNCNNEESSSGDGTTHGFIPGENTVTETKVQKHGKSRKALIVGCGGAGKAAAVAAGDLGFTVTLMNRTTDKAAAIASALPEYGFKIMQTENFAETFAESDIVIYTLPCPLPELDSLLNHGTETTGKSMGNGSTEKIGKNTRISNNTDRRNHVSKIILEANYRNPSFTPDILQRLNRIFPGLQYIPGQQWLLYQAFAGYVHFTGDIPDLKAMLPVLGH